MKLRFFKFQGTGNDFIMIDGRSETVNFSADEISSLCDRRFGIGADGIIILKNHYECDFEMDYYNADGTQSFCGNGSRCAQAFAKQLGIITDQSYFLAIDGFHHGKSEGELFATKMGDVDKVEEIGNDYFVHTGSPHYIRYVEDVEVFNVYEEGKHIRNSETYKNEGTNVNFVTEGENKLQVRTYERGVEGETYSCGTGVTAVAISYLVKSNAYKTSVPILTKGGRLRIDLERKGETTFENIWLVGPAKEVFEGEFNV